MSTELERLVFLVRMMRALHVDAYAGIGLGLRPVRWTPQDSEAQEALVAAIIEEAKHGA